MRRVSVLALVLVGLLAVGRGAVGVAQDGTPAAPADDPEALVRAFYEPFNTGDVGIYEQILAPDWADHPLAPGQQPGAAGFGPVVTGFRAAFPDLQIVNEDILVDGDRVAVRSTFRGTHQGPLFGIPATGRSVEAMAIDIHRLAGGRIAETWHVEDWLTVLGQLGLLPGGGTPPPGTPPAENGDGAAGGVTVTTIDIAFEPAEFSVPADTEVPVTLPNEGALPHNFSVDALGIDVNINPGETQETTINAPAGEYEYYCNVTGHKEAGMVGTMTAE